VPISDTPAPSQPEISRRDLWLFGVTIFLGAFLLFQVQPVIGKYILPWFGGTPGVWTTCLLFFQCLLLGGYAYAHWLSRLAPARQATIHLTLLGMAGGILGVVVLLMLAGYRPIELLKPDPATAAGSPVMGILLLLVVGIGLPYLVLSSTGPLVQAWFARRYEGRSPYRLYALSNVGSLLALVSYPFLVEPYTSRGLQVGAWAAGMVVFALVCGMVARTLRTLPEETREEEKQSSSEPLDLRRQLLWLLLPACGTAQLMATTNKVSQDVAVTPFLWVLPLTLYLLSFIIAFDNPRWYSRLVYTPLLVGCWVATLWGLKKGVDADLLAQVGIFNATLFVGCMVCHGELYQLRPEPARLTRYFLTIAAGGALGGLFVALGAPSFFDGYWEYHLSLWGCGALLTGVCFVDKTRVSFNAWWVRLVLVGCWLAACWAAYRKAGVFVPHVYLLCLRLLLVGCLVAYVLKMAWKTPPQWPRWRLVGFGALGAVCSLADGVLSLELSGYRGLLTSPVVLAPAFLMLMAINFVWMTVRDWSGWRLPLFVPLALLVAVLGGLLLAQTKKDRKDIASQSRNFYGVVRIYDYGAVAYTLEDHDTDVTRVAVSPGGRLLATASSDGGMWVRDCESGAGLFPLNTGGAAVRAMAFSPVESQTILVTGDEGGFVRVWDVAGEGERAREEQRIGGLPGVPTGVAVSPDGRFLVAACADGVLRRWRMDAAGWKELPGIEAHVLGTTVVAFSGVNECVTGGADGRVCVFNLEHGTKVRELEPGGPVKAMAMNEDGVLAAGDAEGRVHFWKVASGDLLQVIETGQGKVNGLAFNRFTSGEGELVPVADRLAVACADGGTSIWQLGAGRWRRIFTLPKHAGGASGVTFIEAASWMPEQNTMKEVDWVVTGGVDKVVKIWNVDEHERRLVNGRILHGVQYSNPARAEMRTSYYGSLSGVGLALDLRREKGRGQRVGVVGLGTGSVAVYAGKGDDYVFYDINPEVERIAEEEFSYLLDARRRGAKASVVLGDARLVMEQEKSRGFDVLVLDAFSSDAIPVHLLTREALEIYAKHMDEKGVIAVHISNRHLRLEGVAFRLAHELGWEAVRVVVDETGAGLGLNLYTSDWVLLTRNREFIKETGQAAFQGLVDGYPLWTDDHVSLLPIVSPPEWWTRVQSWFRGGE